ncbi:hypothetical protein Daus18300_010544 [Diaporthe australafricana]|uniref:Uncharacterized protein n=1 Tax=Diaporthe australafricana TaxID=127596 RepID=A0ABR3WAA8_9PEZI
MSNPNQKVAAGEQWGEAEIEQALKRLGDLHHQASSRRERPMRSLRSTIPRAIEPLSIPSLSPDATLSTLRESTKTAYSEIREYKQAATNEETVKVFEHAKQSRKENPKGIKPWRAKDDPNWLTING